MTLIIIAAVSIVTIISIAIHNIRKQRMVAELEGQMRVALKKLKGVYRMKAALQGDARKEVQGLRYALYQMEWSLKDDLNGMSRDLDEVLGL